jgi:hypothetical protein
MPTDGRLLHPNEWDIVSAVFGRTLPFRQRIFVMNGLGADNAPFTVPTSAISGATIPAMIAAGLNAVLARITGRLGHALTIFHNESGTGPTFALAIPSQVLSAVNLGYIMNVGPDAFPDMTATQDFRRTLVHETTHVWQGKNSIFSMTYVINSAFNQCQGMMKSSRSAAYGFKAGSPFHTYNAEQQAYLVETWYDSGSPTSGPLWPYIRDYIRKGKA